MLVTLHKCHRDFEKMFLRIDGAFQAPLKHIVFDPSDAHERIVLAL